MAGGEEVVLQLQVHEAALQRVAGVAHQVRVGVAAALQQRHMLRGPELKSLLWLEVHRPSTNLYHIV